MNLRHRFQQLSVALGNERPPLLLSLEHEIIRTLISISLEGVDVEKAVYDLTRTEIWKQMEELTDEDPSFDFFTHIRLENGPSTLTKLAREDMPQIKSVGMGHASASAMQPAEHQGAVDEETDVLHESGAAISDRGRDVEEVEAEYMGLHVPQGTCKGQQKEGTERHRNQGKQQSSSTTPKPTAAQRGVNTRQVSSRSGQQKENHGKPTRQRRTAALPSDGQDEEDEPIQLVKLVEPTPSSNFWKPIISQGIFVS